MRCQMLCQVTRKHMFWISRFLFFTVSVLFYSTIYLRMLPGRLCCILRRLWFKHGRGRIRLLSGLCCIVDARFREFPIWCIFQWFVLSRIWVMGWAECFRHQAGAFTFVFRVQSLTVAWNELSVCIGCLQGKIDVICVSLGMNSFFLSLYK